MRAPFYREIVGRFGVEPARDCFATSENARCTAFWTEEDDALSKVWGKGEVLWMNPPWRLWPQVAEKLMGSTCEAIVVCPAWSKP